MSSGPLSTMWPKGTLDLREPRLEGQNPPKIGKVKKPKKLVSLNLLSPNRVQSKVSAGTKTGFKPL